MRNLTIYRDGHPRIVLSKALTSSYKVCWHPRSIQPLLIKLSSKSGFSQLTIWVNWFGRLLKQALGSYVCYWLSCTILLLKFVNWLLVWLKKRVSRSRCFKMSSVCNLQWIILARLAILFCLSRFNSWCACSTVDALLDLCQQTSVFDIFLMLGTLIASSLCGFM